MSNAVLEFDHAYAKRYSPITDSLIVLVSEDCGNSWSRLLALGENGNGNFATHILSTNGFVPQTTDDWCGSGYGSECNTIDLSEFLGKSNIKFAFESYNANGNPLYIDNIKISQFVDVDQNILNTEEIDLFPNPTKGSFTININENQYFEKVEIFNYLGQLVNTSNINKTKSSVKINTKSELMSGVYFVKISGQGKSISRKLIIN